MEATGFTLRFGSSTVPIVAERPFAYAAFRERRFTLPAPSRIDCLNITRYTFGLSI